MDVRFKNLWFGPNGNRYRPGQIYQNLPERWREQLPKSAEVVDSAEAKEEVEALDETAEEVKQHEANSRLLSARAAEINSAGPKNSAMLKRAVGTSPTGETGAEEEAHAEEVDEATDRKAPAPAPKTATPAKSDEKSSLIGSKSSDESTSDKSKK